MVNFRKPRSDDHVTDLARVLFAAKCELEPQNLKTFPANLFEFLASSTALGDDGIKAESSLLVISSFRNGSSNKSEMSESF